MTKGDEPGGVPVRYLSCRTRRLCCHGAWVLEAKDSSFSRAGENSRVTGGEFVRVGRQVCSISHSDNAAMVWHGGEDGCSLVGRGGNCDADLPRWPPCKMIAITGKKIFPPAGGLLHPAPVVLLFRDQTNNWALLSGALMTAWGERLSWERADFLRVRCPEKNGRVRRGSVRSIGTSGCLPTNKNE